MAPNLIPNAVKVSIEHLLWDPTQYATDSVLGKRSTDNRPGPQKPFREPQSADPALPGESHAKKTKKQSEEANKEAILIQEAFDAPTEAHKNKNTPVQALVTSGNGDIVMADPRPDRRIIAPIRRSSRPATRASSLASISNSNTVVRASTLTAGSRKDPLSRITPIPFVQSSASPAPSLTSLASPAPSLTSLILAPSTRSSATPVSESQSPAPSLRSTATPVPESQSTALSLRSTATPVPESQSPAPSLRSSATPVPESQTALSLRSATPVPESQSPAPSLRSSATPVSESQSTALSLRSNAAYREISPEFESPSQTPTQATFDQRSPVESWTDEEAFMKRLYEEAEKSAQERAAKQAKRLAAREELKRKAREERDQRLEKERVQAAEGETAKREKQRAEEERAVELEREKGRELERERVDAAQREIERDRARRVEAAERARDERAREVERERELEREQARRAEAVQKEAAEREQQRVREERAKEVEREQARRAEAAQKEAAKREQQRVREERARVKEVERARELEREQARRAEAAQKEAAEREQQRVREERARVKEVEKARELEREQARRAEAAQKEAAEREQQRVREEREKEIEREQAEAAQREAAEQEEAKKREEKRKGKQRDVYPSRNQKGKTGRKSTAGPSQADEDDLQEHEFLRSSSSSSDSDTESYHSPMDVESSDSSEDSEDARDEDFEGIIEGPGPSRPLKGHQPRKKKTKQYRDPTPPLSVPASGTIDTGVLAVIQQHIGLLGEQIHKLQDSFVESMDQFTVQTTTERKQDRNNLLRMETKLDAIPTVHAPTGVKQSSKRPRQGKVPSHIVKHPFKSFYLTWIRNYVDGDLLNLYPSAAKPQEEGVEEGDETERAEDAAVEDDDQQPTGQRLLRFPPLSDADYKNSIQQGPGHFNLSLSNFRLEFTRSPTDVLNKRALHIASQGFAAALKSGRFPKRFDNGQPVPKEFTEYKVIYALVESHFIYLSKMYKEAAHPNAAEKQEVRLKKINESTRKNTLYKERVETCNFYEPLQPHVPLIIAAGPAAMSEDESDHQLDSDGEITLESWKRSSPHWRSQMFGTLFHGVDDYTRLRKRSRIGRKIRAPGSKARVREHSDRTYKSSTVPTGLPKNAYSLDYLSSLEKWELTELARKKTFYDFAIPSVAEFRDQNKSSLGARGTQNAGGSGAGASASRSGGPSQSSAAASGSRQT